MIPNINQLMTQLRMLPDQALRRVAMMYKQDPYILPLVVSESMARKQLRMASQARTVAPQPKVNEQAVASLGYTPEEVGIAGLAAPNMQGMADGGIAGYDDGGAVVMSPGMLDFAQRSEPVVRMAEGGVARYQDQGLVQGGPPQGLTAKGEAVGVTPYGGIYGGGRLLPTTTGYEGMSIEEFLRAAYNDVSAYVKSLYDKVPKESLAQVVAEDLAKKKSQEAAQRPATGGRRSAGIGGAQIGEREAYEAQLAGKKPAAEAGAKDTGGAGAAGGAGGAGGRTARDYLLGTVEGAKAAASAFLPLNEYQTALNVQQQRERERDEAAAMERERTKPKGKAREGLEALLQKEAEGTEKEMGDAKAFALINAGLAIASGESPNTLANIAKGLNVGAREYQAAVKDLKKADRERKLMLADIQEARRLEERGDWKEAQDRLEKSNDRRAASERFTLTGLQGLGVTNAQIAAGFYKTEREQQGAAERVRAQDPLALYRALGDGDVKKGVVFFQNAKAEPMTESKLKQTWAGNPSLQLQYPSVQDFIKMMQSTEPSSGATDTTGFKVVGVRNP